MDKSALCNAKSDRQHGRRKAPCTFINFNINLISSGDDVWKVRGQRHGNTCRRLSSWERSWKNALAWASKSQQMGVDLKGDKHYDLKASNLSCQLSRAGADERPWLDRNCATAVFDNTQHCLLGGWWMVTCWGERNPCSNGKELQNCLKLKSRHELDVRNCQQIGHTTRQKQLDKWKTNSFQVK